MEVFRKRSIALILTVLIVISMIPIVSAEGVDPIKGVEGYGNNPSESDDLMQYDNHSEVYLDVSQYNILKVNQAINLNEAYNFGPGTLIFTSVSNGVYTWSSTYPISYLFVKTGNITITNPKFIILGSGQENQEALLYNLGEATSGQMEYMYQQGISHFYIFWKTPTAGRIIVNKGITGDDPTVPATFTFKLYKDTETLGTAEQTKTITGSGQVIFEDVPFGNYIVKEESIPDQYAVSVNDQKVTVDLTHMAPVLNFSNKFTENHFITLTKRVEGENPPADALFTFNLYNKVGDAFIESCSIKAGQSYQFQSVPLGEYYIKEVGLPNGFTPKTGNSMDVSVNPNDKNPNVTFYNTYEPDKYNIKVIKTVYGEPLTAKTFTFQLWQKVNAIDSLENKETDDVLKDTQTIVGEGEATFISVDAGSYYVKELINFTDYSLESLNDVPVNVGPEITMNPIGFINKYIAYPISVRKSLSDDSDDPVDSNVEFTFDLYKKGDMTTILQTIKLKVNQTDSFYPVLMGEYVVVERKGNMPEGYELVAEPGEEAQSIKVGPDIDPVTLNFINRFTRLYEIEVYKDLYPTNSELRNLIGTTAVLPSFEFKLYNTDEPDVVMETINVLAYSTGKFKPVAAGNYKVVESKTNASYVLYVGEGETSPEVPFDLNTDYPGKELIFVNRFVQTFEIEVEKTAIGGSANQVFTFRLYKGDNSEYSQQITITGSGKASFEPVGEGEYFVREVLVSGYTLETPNDVPAVVNSDFPKVTVSFRNRYEETTETTDITETTVTTEITTEPSSELTTESTEIFTTEGIPGGAATFEETEEISEDVPKGPALPQTGQASPEIFYGLGSLVSLIGVYMKRNSKK